MTDQQETIETIEQPPAWQEMIGDENLREKAGKFTAVDELVKSYSELESRLGRSVVKPGKDADAAEIESFYKSLGRPETADSYELVVPEEAPMDDHFIDQAKDWFHDAGLTPDQANKLVGHYMNFAGASQQEIQAQLSEQRGEAEETLRRDWGGQYQTNISHAKRAMGTFFGGEIAEMPLPDGGLLGSHPDFVKGMAQIGKMLGEDGAKLTKADAGSGKSLEEELSDLMNAKDYWHNPKIQERVREINIALYGAKKTG